MKEELSRKADITVTTTVEFTFEDGSKETFDIPHFNPVGEDEIQKGIDNRFITEQEKRK